RLTSHENPAICGEFVAATRGSSNRVPRRLFAAGAPGDPGAISLTRSVRHRQLGTARLLSAETPWMVIQGLSVTHGRIAWRGNKRAWVRVPTPFSRSIHLPAFVL